MADHPAKSSPHVPSSGCPAATDHDREVPEVDLLSPHTISGWGRRNRIGLAARWQDVARDGVADDWRLVHLGSGAVGGVALVMVGATAVTADGRITRGNLGI